MAGQNTGLQRTYVLEDAEGKMFTGMTYGSGEGSVKAPTADNAPFVGVITNDERLDDPLRAGGSQAGRNITVQVGGYGSIRLAGTVEYGDKLILAADGKAKKMPAAIVTDETYNVIGEAQKGGDADDVVPFKIEVMSVFVPKV